MKSLVMKVVVVALLIILVQNEDRFCSAYCKNKKCNTIDYTGCTQCANPFTFSGGLCVVDVNTDYELLGSEQAGSFSYTGGTKSGTCDDDSNENYIFYGNFTETSLFSVQLITTTNFAFYQLRFIFWAILMDNWDGSDNVSAALYGDGTLVGNQTVHRGQRWETQKLCGNNGNYEDYIHFDKSWNYNTQGTTIRLDISAKGGGNQPWGAKDFILLARKCNIACTACWGGNNNQCTVCDDDLGYKLSGTTCDFNCLPGYGDTIAGNVCVLCDVQCAVCFQLSYNCSSCTTSGTNQAFLLAYNSSCERDCPVGYFQNYTAQTCDLCNLECISCNGQANYCFECDKTQGYAWNSYTCYNPCPIGTFIDNNNTNCTDCSPYCIECSGAPDTCSRCQISGTYVSYLLNTTCLRTCPDQYYEETNNGTQHQCLACDISCFQCSGAPTPCTICNPNYYLFQSACGLDCTEPGYFTDEVTWTCLLCSQFCVGLNMSMSFSNARNEKIYVDMVFSEDLDFSTFPYQTFQTFSFDSDLFTLDMFNFEYTITNTYSYRITISPKGYIFLYNVTLTCTTMDQPSTLHQAINGRPFKTSNYALSSSLVWFLIEAPDLTDGQKQIIEGLSNLNDNISYYTTLPYVQEIKKTGIFAFLMGGAQITSCSMLVNNIQSQNQYEGVRFWGTFVFFDVPKWQQNSDKTKYVIVPSVTDVVKDARLLQERTLFDIHSVDWRFQRTGHTSFFIFDCYLQIFMIVFCWILLLIGYCLNKKKPVLYKKHMGKFFSFVHKVHEISILYISIATLLEWIYFNANSLERWLSFSFCLLMNIYFLIYELYIYHDMLKYPVAAIGTEKYEHYAIRYGSLLKNIRFVEYDIKQSWSPKQWFRPYNYHILSYYKKFMMMVSLPLFYDTTHAQIGVLIALQLFQIIRFCVTWPFLKTWRNIYRLVLECALELFFICVLIQGFLVQEIMKNNEDTLSWTITLYYRLGWVGFAMVFFFNIGFLVLLLIDVYRGCKMSNRQMMDEARRVYYYDKLKSYEQENEDVPIGLVNKWVKLGNLNERDYDELPDINLRVQYFRIAKNMNKPAYEVEMKKLKQLYMNIEFDFHRENNINCGRKLNKRFSLTRQLSKDFYYLVDDLYKKYNNQNVENIIVKTFQKVEQSLYRPGDKVELQAQIMTQKVQIEYYSGEKKIQELPKRLPGFPIPLNDLSFLE